MKAKTVLLKAVLLTPPQTTKDNALRLLLKHNPQLKDGFFFRSVKRITPAVIRKFNRDRWVRVFYPISCKSIVLEFFDEYSMNTDGEIKGRLQYYKYNKEFELI